MSRVAVINTKELDNIPDAIRAVTALHFIDADLREVLLNTEGVEEVDVMDKDYGERFTIEAGKWLCVSPYREPPVWVGSLPPGTHQTVDQVASLGELIDVILDEARVPEWKLTARHRLKYFPRDHKMRYYHSQNGWVYQWDREEWDFARLWLRHEKQNLKIGPGATLRIKDYEENDSRDGPAKIQVGHDTMIDIAECLFGGEPYDD